MSLSILFFAFLAIALPILALAGVAGATASRPWRAAALGLAATGLAAGYIAGAELMGRPKPVRLELIEAGSEEARLIASHYMEGKAIWLWLLLPGEEAPRAYALPWSREVAQALRRAEAEAEENGTGVRMRRPFQSERDDSAPMFHAPPRPPMPEKSTG